MPVLSGVASIVVPSKLRLIWSEIGFLVFVIWSFIACFNRQKLKMTK